MTGFPQKVRDLVAERSGLLCEGCGGSGALELHHRKFKSRGGQNTVENALALCGFGNHTGCHGLAHSSDPPPGWSVHSWENPADVGVLRRGVLCFLTASGDLIEETLSTGPNPNDGAEKPSYSQA